MTITVTDNAASQISHLCQRNLKLVRLAINAGGCQGFSKSWELCDDTDPDDNMILCEPSGKLIIDPMSMDILGDAVIDYKTELNGSYFTVEIASATSQCGCGTSFSI